MRRITRKLVIVLRRRLLFDRMYVPIRLLAYNCDFDRYVLGLASIQSRWGYACQ
jgi:hypothetical protein